MNLIDELIFVIGNVRIDKHLWGGSFTRWRRIVIGCIFLILTLIVLGAIFFKLGIISKSAILPFFIIMIGAFVLSFLKLLHSQGRSYKEHLGVEIKWYKFAELETFFCKEVIKYTLLYHKLYNMKVLDELTERLEAREEGERAGPMKRVMKALLFAFIVSAAILAVNIAYTQFYGMTKEIVSSYIAAVLIGGLVLGFFAVISLEMFFLKSELVVSEITTIRRAVERLKEDCLWLNDEKVQYRDVPVVSGYIVELVNRVNKGRFES